MDKHSMTWEEVCADMRQRVSLDMMLDAEPSKKDDPAKNECVDYKIDILKSKGKATLCDYFDAIKGVADGELSMDHIVWVMEMGRNDIHYLDDIITPFLQAHKDEFCSWVEQQKETIRKRDESI